ncbi:acetyl-CoA carboxylase, biotin carboxyl carrier protein [Parapedobacter defluvii]|uniref:Biotin carboxyl carrier protein of acetyl-CoA carboxylase n=2 Tax=Parapedobacter defluvii TaxID=2045106 RepID=A0ABQ1LK62_9SPHI|nr:acetyl-CoA carboxylase biotin carboxyl carrier protein [Parapedobacter defluvii]RQP19400.1 MAG: acetyl-CoA carboxylase biotin carboxyl carrier protein [Parapedobacter sp.]GGC24567.1 acetyl-CoA carboxylase, biotin carboxyl carrier protein [Parapedobacter defluvii]
MSMDIKQIQDLIKFVAKSGVNEVSIEEEDFKITIKTNQAPTYVTATVPTAPQVQPAATVPAPAAEAPQPTAPKTEDTSNYVTIKSPMIGTFYRSPSPDKPVFVNVGDEITAGKVVCIVEAMKLFNEIESEVSGRIVKILVDDAQPVEYDQPLFLVEPK